MTTIKPNALIHADCMTALSCMPDESVDLVYLDPPFNSNADYKAAAGSKAEGAEFKDRWSAADVDKVWAAQLSEMHGPLAAFITAAGGLHSSGMMAYLLTMTQVLFELRRVLASTGSIYLHCNQSASHYLKGVMDGVFGKANYRNDIVWSYRKMSTGIKGFQRNHDVILFYAKGGGFTFNRQHDAFGEGSGTRHRYAEKIGYNLNRKRKMATVWDWDKFNAAVKAGAIKNADELSVAEFSGKGPNASAVWDMPILSPTANERTGYPTQKPLALLHRVIKASSNEGDVVLDPYCGSGTACVAAAQLDRKWIGIDKSANAVKTARVRLMNECGALLCEFNSYSKGDLK